LRKVQYERRFFAVDVLKCPRCSASPMRILAAIHPPAAQAILKSTGLPTRAPPVAPAHGHPTSTHAQPALRQAERLVQVRQRVELDLACHARLDLTTQGGRERGRLVRVALDDFAIRRHGLGLHGLSSGICLPVCDPDPSRASTCAGPYKNGLPGLHPKGRGSQLTSF